MSFLLGIIACILIAVWASQGYAYRALYAGAALVSLVLGGCFALVSNPRDLVTAAASGDRAQAAGAELLGAYGRDAALVLLLIAFGALVGAIIYRAKPTA